MVLLHLSLIGGFSAPKIDKVLTSTGYLTKAGPGAYRRVLETYQMVAHCLTVGGLHVWADDEERVAVAGDAVIDVDVANDKDDIA